MHAALFPGQGSQGVGMGSDLYQTFSCLRFLFQEAEDQLKLPLKRIMFEGPEEDLKRTRFAQPAIFLHSMAIMQVLKEEAGIEPSFFSAFAGHSLGEYSALCACGVFSFAQGLALIGHRSEIMEAAPEGTMLAVIGMDFEGVNALVAQVEEGFCAVANDNSPLQVVVSGTVSALTQVACQVEEKGAKAIFLNVSGPFHSQLMEERQSLFIPFLDKVSFLPPCRPVLTNVSGKMQTDPTVLKDHVKQQMAHPVLWRTTQMTLVQQGILSWSEIGPGRVLSGLARKTAPAVQTWALQESDALIQWMTHHGALSSLAS